MNLSLHEIIIRLESDLSTNSTIKFEATKRANMKKAKLKDGSVVVIAAFEKGKNKTLAMIDFENIRSFVNRARSAMMIHINY